MSITVTFYNFAKKTNSTARPASSDAVLSASCVLKDAAVMTHPVIELKTSSTPVHWNYAYIQDFDRYYFIAQWEYFRGVWIAHMDVDAPASWKNTLSSHRLYVTRSSDTSITDGEIADGRYPFKSELTITKKISSCLPAAGANINGQYIASVAGLDFNGTSGSGFLWFATAGSLTGFCAYVQWLCEPFTDGRTWADYINSVVWFPYTGILVPTTGSDITSCTISGAAAPIDNPPTAAGFTAKMLSSNPVASDYETISMPDHPDKSRGAWLNTAAGTDIILTHPCFGEKKLDVTALVSIGSGRVHFFVDYASGECTVSIEYGGTAGQAGATYESFSFEIGVPVPIKGVQSAPARAAISGLSAVTDILSLNFTGAVNDIANVSNILAPQPILSGNVGSRSGFARGGYFIYRYKRLVEEDLANEGRPVCANITLSTISGYIECDGVEELQLPATPEEIDTIKSMLTGGLYLE